VVKGKDKNPPPLAEVEEVVQAKLREERTRRAWELNLKIRGLPLPSPSLDPMQVGTMFLRDNLEISDLFLRVLGLELTLHYSFGSGQLVMTSGASC
jgi:hypothetical protein